jgi:citrate lyase beta subunit
MERLETIRSLLFAPGSDERKVVKALGSDADAVVVDLEDGVAPGEKDAARALAVRILTETAASGARMVRVNSGSNSDLRAVLPLGLDAIVLPKAEPGDVARLPPDCPPVIAIVETAAGLRAAFELASEPRVEALFLGSIDLGVELGLERRSDGLELLHARSRLVLDSAAAGIRGPFDGVYADVGDPDGLAREVALGRSLGMRGKGCIHPAQVAVVNEGFAPRQAEVEWARRVVAAYEEGVAAGRGAVSVEGEMIDLPVVKRARGVLGEAERRG